MSVAAIQSINFSRDFVSEPLVLPHFRNSYKQH